MGTRRSFITGMLAAGLAPKPGWADADNPAFLSAGMRRDGSYVLCGLRDDGAMAFELPLPARGHAAAAHPFRPEAVVFARRPGTYAVVLDCSNGQRMAQIEAPKGRHFYGHGAFSHDGDLLLTTENDFKNARGVVGMWDVRRGYERISEFWSGGIGPHDIKLIPGSATLVVANGGIETHPDTGRTKLNLPTMRSNLTYVDFDGGISNQIELGREHQRSSIRHLAISERGTVVFGMQWQGDLALDLSLLGLHDLQTDGLDFAKEASIRRLHGYVGSVATTPDGEEFWATSPRAGLVQRFRRATFVAEDEINDVCGVAASAIGRVLTSGTGLVQPAIHPKVLHSIAWDNHLIAIQQYLSS